MTKPINPLSITDKKRIKKAAAFVYTVKTKLTTLQQLLLEMTNERVAIRRRRAKGEREGEREEYEL